MKNVLILCVLSVLLFPSCTENQMPCPDFLLEEGTISAQEEYLIVEVIVDSELSTDFVHIYQRTYSNSDSSSLAIYFEVEDIQVSEMAISEYISLNSKEFIWGDLFTERRNLISDGELQCLFDSSANGLGSYKEKYPDSAAFLVFGRPIIEGEQAVVTYVYGCGAHCSAGYTVTLEKVDGDWQIVKRHIVWVS